MPADPNLQVTGLDFQDHRDDLIRYLQSQPRYRDYDFEGSNIRVLIDVLAYNAWKQSFYVNLDFAEAFLDSAQLRGSVVSRAKDLNYLPRSAASARATVNVSFESTNAVVTFQKGQTFSSAVDGRSLTFSVPETVVLVGVEGQFTKQLDIMEGPYLSDSYAFNSSDETQKLLLTNDTADTSSLVVVVYEDGGTVGQTYTVAKTTLDLDEQSRAFFVQQEPDGRYRVLFGDGVVGRQPKDGSIIVLDYRVSQGDGGNGAKKFTCDFTPDGAESITVQTVDVSSGGMDRETIDSIRFYAPRHFQVQERATSDPDYETILKEQFPEIRNVSVYGGEEVDPPQYARVFVAVDIEGTEKIPDSRKSAYYSFLKPRCPKTITPVFCSPDYTYASISSEVTYDQGQGDLTPDLAASVVLQAITSFADANLGTFSATLRFSRLCTAIDASDDGVVGNDTSVLAYKKSRPMTATPQTMVIDFGFALDDVGDEWAVKSDPYTLGADQVFVKDSGGKLCAVKTVGDTTVLVAEVGSVDYSTGKLNLSSWKVDDFEGRYLKFFVRPLSKDLASGKNTILLVEPDQVSVSVILL